MGSRIRRQRHKGNILVFSVFVIIGLMALLALSVDIGVLLVARDQAQRAADSAAMAATWELIDPAAPTGVADLVTLDANARVRAAQYAGLNAVLREDPSLGEEDVQVGFLLDPSDRECPLDTSGAFAPNAVRVSVRRSAGQNSEIPLFFARVLGINTASVEAEATAALLTNIRGFRTPSDGSPLELMPFALDQETWDAAMAGTGSDNWKMSDGQVVSGSDNILEMNLYPQGTGAAGNRGTLDIGSDANSTQVICRQVLYGASKEDLEYHGGSLELDEYGELHLNGDTGISAGVEDELLSIKGQPRIIPIFSDVQNPGNNADYTLVKFCCVRIMEVKLDGKMSRKRVIIQPANIVAKGALPAGANNTSDFIYSPVWLVR